MHTRWSRVAMSITFALAWAGCDSKAPATGTATHLPECGQYRSAPTDCHGSPENPSCSTLLTLQPDGTGTMIGDDVVEDITYRVTGDAVAVTFAGGDPWITLTREASTGDLLDEDGERYVRSACD